jgi:hypothetical protein
MKCLKFIPPAKPAVMKILLFVFLFVLFSQFTSAQYAPGYYIDSTGKKVPGLLKYEYGGSIFTNTKNGACRLFYKPDSASKATKFTDDHQVRLR